MPTLKSYTLGFTLSVAMTLFAFGMVWFHVYTLHRLPSHPQVLLLLVTLAVLQLVVQLFFFLHFGKEKKTHWNAAVFGFALFIVVVVVGGTLWIMNNLQHQAAESTPFINNIVTVQNEA